MNTPLPRPAWMQRRERGNLLALRVMSAISLHLGRSLSRTVVYGIALYYVLSSTAARKASRAYLARVLGRPAGPLDLFRHVFAFASTIHDRVYLLNERHDLFEIRSFGNEPVETLNSQGHIGAFLFGAHLGSFEVLRTMARRVPDLKLSVAMYPDNARLINETLAAINPDAVQDIIALGKLDSILEVHRKLQDGHLIGILADRATGPDEYLSLDFLGSPASFPTGPFRLAAMLGHPVYFMAGLYQGGNCYELHFERLSDPDGQAAGDRQALARRLLERYVAALERHCRAAPYNWFNFFDFWETQRLGQA